MLGGILGGLWDIDGIAEVSDLTVGGKERLGGFIVLFKPAS